MIQTKHMQKHRQVQKAHARTRDKRAREKKTTSKKDKTEMHRVDEEKKKEAGVTEKIDRTRE
jgi:hypothetical protein